ncbi:MAG: hypothetical protein WCF85_00870 [Rhodospirillaceae bacterium]
MPSVLISALLITLALVLSAPEVRAQSRPAPETPGISDPVESAVPRRPTSASALRVLVVTTGIIGGFIAADFFTGGALTAPLLGRTGAVATRGGSRFAPATVNLRPIILPPVR